MHGKILTAHVPYILQTQWCVKQAAYMDFWVLNSKVQSEISLVYVWDLTDAHLEEVHLFKCSASGRDGKVASPTRQQLLEELSDWWDFIHAQFEEADLLNKSPSSANDGE